MGLDSVLLLEAIEEEFGLEIPDQEAEKMVTVGDTFNYLKGRVKTISPEDCLTQRVFYKLRRALIQNYKLHRHAITPDTVLSELLSLKEIEEGWPYLQMFIDLRTPSFKESEEIFGIEFNIKVLTIRQIIQRLIRLNANKLDLAPARDEEIFERLVDTIVRQQNVDRHEVTLNARYALDLGVD
ncbi:MAG: hypothetical protein C0507_20475 [Cyanobacteria bacterium PR.3.49]|nr:hypothetical protein [Cyanobacteria bacterium PR.3.49]